MYSRKAIKKLKSAGEIAIGFASAGRAECKMATEVHRDGENILTKVGGRSHIGICGFIRGKANGG